MIDDHELIQNIKNGDSGAFQELVNKYRKKAFRIAYQFVGNIEDAAEIAQDAFVRVHRSVGRFDGKSTFYTWFYRILVNLCLDFKKKKKISLTTFSQFNSNTAQQDFGGQWVQDEVSESPVKRLELQEVQDKIIKAVNDLSEKQKVVFILRHYEKMALKDIAELLNMAEGTVKSHLARAILKLKETLHDVYKKGGASDEM